MVSYSPDCTQRLSSSGLMSCPRGRIRPLDPECRPGRAWGSSRTATVVPLPADPMAVPRAVKNRITDSKLRIANSSVLLESDFISIRNSQFVIWNRFLHSLSACDQVSADTVVESQVALFDGFSVPVASACLL